MYTLREWAPLSDLFNKLPTKVQLGLFPQEVKITCIDALSEFLVLGTNVGIVYWYDRKKGTLERLRCENSNSCLTAVKVTSTVDYMVACGNKDGNISIFQIPKSHPDNLPDSLKPKHNKQVERYTVSEMHNSSITTLEWSKNGMKLFSGDKNGMVVLTEIDFYMHLCKSMEVLNETYEIIQLSYHHQKLLISTTYRSIICQKNEKWKVTQIGKKDRKILGNFGGIFYQIGLKPTDIILYCVRPGLRIWESDLNGIVQKTLLFKDILNTESPEVPLINPISNNMKSLKPSKEASFGKLLHYAEESLVTFNNDVIYILNPKELTIIATISNLRNCLDVATTKDEIFILEGPRSVIRISTRPEIGEDISNSMTKSLMQIPQSLRDLSNILNTNSIIAAIPPFIDNAANNEFSIHTDETAIINAEEAVETDARSKVLGNQDLKAKLEIYKRIGTEEFDDTILFKHSARKTKHNNCMTSSTTSVSSNSSDSEKDVGKVIKPSIMNLSTVGLVPDLRSPETILNDIKEKEDKLADILNIGNIKINLDDLQQEIDEEPIMSKLNDVTLWNVKQELPSTTCKETAVIKDNRETSSKVLQTSDSNKSSSSEKESAVPTTFFYKDCLEEYNGPPVCINIPTDWNLKNVQIEQRQVPEQNDVALTDWEII